VGYEEEYSKNKKIQNTVHKMYSTVFITSDRKECVNCFSEEG